MTVAAIGPNNFRPLYKEMGKHGGQTVLGTLKSLCNAVSGLSTGASIAGNVETLEQLEGGLGEIVKTAATNIEEGSKVTSGVGKFFSVIAPNKIWEYLTHFYAKASFGIRQNGSLFGGLLKSAFEGNIEHLTKMFDSLKNVRGGALGGAAIALSLMGVVGGSFFALNGYTKLRATNAKVDALDAGDPTADTMNSVPFHMTQLALNVGTIIAGISMFFCPGIGFVAALGLTGVNKAMDLYKHFTVESNMFRYSELTPWYLRPLTRNWCNRDLSTMMNS